MSVPLIKIARQGKVIATVPPYAVPAGIKSGRFLFTDHYWTEGMNDWRTLAEFQPTAFPAPSSPPATSSDSTPGLSKLLTKPEWLALPDGDVPKCPRCGSDEMRTFPILHKSGMSNSSSVGITMSGEVGAMGTSTASALATELSPPKDQYPSEETGCASEIFAIFIIIGGAAAGGTTGFIVGFGIALILFYFVAKIDTSKEQSLNGRRAYAWRNSWCCMKCGSKAVSLHPKAIEASKAIDAYQK